MSGYGYGHWRPQRTARELAPHRNHGLEVVVVRSGRLRWQVEGVAEDVGPGDAFFTLPWQEHGGVSPLQPNSDLSFVIIPLASVKPACRRFAPGLGLALAEDQERAVLDLLAGTTRHAHPAGADLLRTVERLVDALGGGPANRVRPLATLAVLELAEAVAATAQPPGDDPGQRVRRFLAHLAQECHQPWTLAGMAARCHLGRTRFTELVERETGDSPGRLLLRLRAARLADLLTTTTRPITDLALDCGFCSSQHGARVFRAFHGTSPRAWRNGGTRG